MIEASYGLNYATVLLGNGWKTWTQGANPRGLEHHVLESAFVFDALVQNVDRKRDNPNLLWKGDQLAVLDFDRAFEYLGQTIAEVIPMLTLKEHVLQPFIALAKEKALGQIIWENWEEWTISNNLDELISGDAMNRPINRLDSEDLQSMLNWFNDFSLDIEKFLQYLTEYSK